MGIFFAVEIMVYKVPNLLVSTCGGRLWRALVETVSNLCLILLTHIIHKIFT